MNRIARPAVAGLMLAAGLAACRKNDAAVDTMAANMDTTAAAAAVTTTPPPSKWTSPNTVGFAWVANTGEIALGKLGQTKAGNADVKKFAALMVTDHTQMRESLDALAKRATIAMDTTMDDVRDLEGMANSDLKDLHCGNESCTVGNQATVVDGPGDVGGLSSLAIGADGLPVVAYKDLGNLATIGRMAAVVDLGKLRFSGLLAWWFWLVMHVIFLIGFRNRLVVLLNWWWAYWSYQRAARIILGDDGRDPPAPE